MYSLAFPDMLTSARVKLIKDHDATLSNLKLILQSERTGLYGDPHFGTDLKRVFFAQNGTILKDLVIDEVYTSIQEFMPQLQLTRNNIKVYQEKLNIYVEISCINLIDYTTDMYTIRLLNAESIV